MRVTTLVLACTLAVTAQDRPKPPALNSQEQSIQTELRGLRKLTDEKRASATLRLANEITALPATSIYRVALAGSLANLSTEGDFGRKALEAVAAMLTSALKDAPIPMKGDRPAGQYVQLAQLARYEEIPVTLEDAAYAVALKHLAADDEARAAAEFSLQDVTGKAWHLRDLKGKVVLVNFWATWCPPCRKEMPDLDDLHRKHRKKGLVVLALSDEPGGTVVPFVKEGGYSYPFLLDTGGKVAKQFRVDGIPKSFVFDREGKLVAQAIDMRTRGQFEAMLKKAGL